MLLIATLHRTCTPILDKFLVLKPRYLEQQALLEQLEGLLSDAFACIDVTDDHKAAEKGLRRQGFKCPQQVYQAAYDHLQVRPQPPATDYSF